MLSSDLRDTIDELAQRQAGHVAAWQLVFVGLTRSQVRGLHARMGWSEVHRGVARVAGSAPSMDGALWAAVLAATEREQRSRNGGPTARWEAAHEAARTSVPVTALSAAWLYGLVTNAPSRPQLLVPHTRPRNIPGVRCIRTRLPLGDQAWVRGIPVPPILRVFWDMAWLARNERHAAIRLRRWMVAADGLRLVRAADLFEVARNPRDFGLPSFVPKPFRVASFSLAKGHSHSASEHTGRTIIADVAKSLGFLAEARPLAIPDIVNPIAEADVAIQVLRLDFEIDGPHHDKPDQQKKDRWRDDQLVQIQWTVRRYQRGFTKTWIASDEPLKPTYVTRPRLSRFHWVDVGRDATAGQLGGSRTARPDAPRRG